MLFIHWFCLTCFLLFILYLLLRYLFYLKVLCLILEPCIVLDPWFIYPFQFRVHIVFI